MPNIVAPGVAAGFDAGLGDGAAPRFHFVPDRGLFEALRNGSALFRSPRSRQQERLGCHCDLNLHALFFSAEDMPIPRPPLSRCEYHEILRALPPRLQNQPWRLRYDTAADGFSLQSFYRRMSVVHDEGAVGLGIFFIADREEERAGGDRETTSTTPRQTTVLGCVTPIVPCADRHSHHSFYGSDETSVFRLNRHGTVASSLEVGSPLSATMTSTLDELGCSMNVEENCNNSSPHSRQGSIQLPRAMSASSDLHPTTLSTSSPFGVGGETREPPLLVRYPWTCNQQNKRFVFSTLDFFGIGGGRDGAAIFVDRQLQYGHSSFCETFCSPPLNGSPRNGLQQSEFLMLRMLWFSVKEDRSEFRLMTLAHGTRRCGCGRKHENYRSSSRSFECPTAATTTHHCSSGNLGC